MVGHAGALTISEVFAETAAHCAERDFLHVPVEACRYYSDAAITLSYADACTRVDAVAARLRAAGYGPAHRIAVALDNRCEFFLWLLAINRCGASIVPINAAMSASELRFLLGHADITLAVTHAIYADRLHSSLPRTTAFFVETADAGSLPPPARAASAQSGEASLLYTSGTTGTPKGCILSNDYFLEIGRLYTGLGGYCRFADSGDRLATPLPVTHMNALACSFMAMLMTGGCLVQLDRFHPSTWWRSIRTSKATAFHYLGVMPAMLLNAPTSKDDDIASSVRFGFGAGTDPRHQAAFEARFGVPLIEAWAMTETGAGAWITANHEPRHPGRRCFGKAPTVLDYRIVDDGGTDVAPGAAGELLVRRAGSDPRRGFFSGYYKDDLATEQVWSEGWFHTGDLVRVDEGGSFFFVDRSKNVVRRSGENIAAVEVESVLQSHPDVRAAAVCPVPDDIRGEEVFAFVVLRPNSPPSLETATQIQAHCRSSLAYYKAPGYVGFRSDLPQTASQKLARAQIKALAACAVDSADAFDLRHLKLRAA